MDETCELCSEPAFSAYNVLAERMPVQDEDGAWWRTYDFVSGPHYRCNGHPLANQSNIIPWSGMGTFEEFLMRSVMDG